MSFGFSVGDFIGALTLAYEITSCLGEAHGAASEYQSIQQILRLMQQCIQRAENVSEPGSEEVKCAALACHQTVTQFLDCIKKYDRSLGEGHLSGHPFRTAVHKLSFRFTKKEDVKKFKDDMSLRLQCLQLQMGKHQNSELLNQHAQSAADFTQRLNSTHADIQAVAVDLEAQTTICRENQTRLRQLWSMVNQSIVQPITKIITMLFKIYITQRATAQVVTQTYVSVQEMRDSISQIDTRFTYFQAPARLEDACGRVIPVPSEYSLSMLKVIIEYNFREGPGNYYVTHNMYHVYNTLRPDEIISDSEDTQIVPGMQLTMAVIVSSSESVERFCPDSSCNSRNIISLRAGGRECHAKCANLDINTHISANCHIKFDVIRPKYRLTTPRDGSQPEVQHGHGFCRYPTKLCADIAKITAPQCTAAERSIERLRNIRFLESPQHLRQLLSECAIEVSAGGECVVRR